MTQNSRGEIFVLDDDAAMRRVMSTTLQEEGYEVIFFADGSGLLSLATSRTPACIFLEVRLPCRSGIDILKKLQAKHYPAPIFVMSGQGDIPTAVEAIKNGALDFIEKPFNSSGIAAQVKAAIDSLPQHHEKSSGSKTASLYLPGSAPLTHREREVLARLAEGATNKEVAQQLGLSPRTVESHRSNIMKKAGVKNVAELFRHIVRGS